MSRGHRQSTTPMDFEWSNQRGPVDQQSPFITATGGSHAAKKRPHSVLDSPSRNAFATPNRPHLRDPDSRPFFFDQSNVKPLPSIPSHVQSAWEPRTPTSNVDFSSGGETPNTPGMDSDQATPDTQLASSMGRLGNGDASSPKKGARRESWFRRAFMPSPSPSKDPPRDDPRKYYSTKAETRIAKRRSRERKKAFIRDDDEGDYSDAEHQSPTTPNPAPTHPTTVQQTFAMSVGGFLSWIEAHPHLPSVLSFYMQLAVNTFLGCLFIYLIYSAWSGVMTDVDIESSKHLSQVMVDIAFCTKEYNQNRCSPEERVPHMENVCGVWQTCMDRDPRKIARASVTARTFARIFNSFTEEFSYKSMIFTAIIIFGGFNLSNWAFGIVRSQQAQQQAQAAQQHQHQHPPPQTPHRVPSNSYADTPYPDTAYVDNQSHWQTQTQNPALHTPYADRRPMLIEHARSSPAVPGVREDVGMGAGRKRGFR
ncbi:hypothetical protein P153DRAFT_428493 [Dothidotthia symphoricarpi CBS 119687]|uniref:Brl1/Brr6 domain-containing protein n=1 Tax=Dothidotthia symphoricarpi CBS 119687 TaxID=1392245 RepID=A0A6A6ANG8_9PLEO|nr:uncharacterized protein P153DRAFT_428493 [Dothidotthia symphoricarpi CBS 119687]KAF2133542.1 hypothetical protein P153DRAFT_428493 [Dothidotthia symphoricarpi CBS 119687]